MIEVIVIVGLPGSGKTQLALSMVDEETTFIDDLSRDPFRMELYMRSQTRRLIITDPVTARPVHIKQRLASWFGDIKHTVEIIAFTNDPDQAFANLTGRGDDRKITWDFVKRMSMQYMPDQYDRVVPVYVPQ